MSFNESMTSGIDLELQQFIEAETQKRRFKVLVHGLTDRCWDVCIGKVNNRLDNKSENCLVNCVERFIDTTNFIVNRFEKTHTPDTNISSFD